MKVEDLIATLNDFPPESPVFAESDLDFLWIEYVSLNSDGDVILSERPA